MKKEEHQQTITRKHRQQTLLENHDQINKQSTDLC